MTHSPTSDVLMGAETEYGFSLIPTGAGAISASDAAGALVSLARSRLRNLPDRNSYGLFLENGSRLYCDCGHAELATPEVVSPFDLVRYQIAGDRLLSWLASELGTKHQAEPVLFKTCVDYHSKVSFGAHESYSFWGDRSVIPPQILPFLASRLVVAGHGGFNNLSRGISFAISPRAHHLAHDVSEDSTSERGLFNTREETLCRAADYHRIHLLHGENLCSPLGSLVRFGSTSLCLKLIEAGLRPGDEIKLQSPVEALRVFTADPGLEATAPRQDGSPVTAIEIQRGYLEWVENCLGEPWMPGWAPSICRAWRDILERLEQCPESLEGSLDWKIKFRLYTRHLERRGFSWDRVWQWNQLLCASSADDPGPVVARAARRGLQREEMDRFMAVRAELFELDVRFSQQSPRGLYVQLAEAGALDASDLAPASDAIAKATADPPEGSRARLRGLLVRELAAARNGYVCDWSGIWDGEGTRCVDFSEPFQTEATWVGPTRDGTSTGDDLDVPEGIRAYLTRRRPR